MPVVPVVRRRTLLAALAALTVLAVACSPRDVDTAPTVDTSLATRIVLVGEDRWTVLVAPEGGQGMRGRSDFGGASGMLFDLGADVDPTAVVFVMDGVALPLDIAWFDDAGDLVGSTSMALCPAEPCPRYAAPADFRWAIEAPPGAFDDLGPTDRLLVGDDPG